MPDSVREQILQNVKTTLLGITETAGYNNTLTRVERSRSTPLDENVEYPAAFVYELPEEIELGASPNMHTRRMLLVVQGWIKSGDEDLSIKANALIADFEKALLLDYTRGGLAVDTELTQITYTIEVGLQVLAVVHVGMMVHYRTVRGDPYTAN